MLGRLFRRKTLSCARPFRWDLSDEILRWSRGDVWTLRDAVEGTLILGATGSGKTSGSGRTIAMSMLNAGFGGLVLTAKSDERALWESYCREANRLGDLCIIDASAALRLNFLAYELNRKGVGAGHTENLCNLFSTIMEIRERNTGSGGGREDGAFWKQGATKLMRNATDLVSLATGSVSVPDLVRIILSAPQTRARVSDRAFQESSFCFQCLIAADQKPKTARQQHDFSVVCDFFLLEWPGLAERARSVIQATFMGWADMLNRGLLRELFCTDTTITPEVVEDGKIILIDLPAKEFGELGVFAQVLFKHVWQRQIERRNVAASPRPVFLWADEAQNFLTSYDFQYQSTCRSSKCATVYLSQSTTNFFAALGSGDKGQNEALSLFNCLNTKLFHANTDVTNDWAASLIGRSRQFMMNGNSSLDADDQWLASVGLDRLRKGEGTSAGFSETFEFEVQPREFTRLKTGGPAHCWIVEGIVFQNGRIFESSGRTWLKTAFRQKV